MLWPAVHRVVVASYDTNAWRLGGFAMYATPPARTRVSIVENLESHPTIVADSDLPAALLEQKRRYTMRRSVLGSLLPPDDLAAAFLAARPDVDQIEVVITRELLSASTARIERRQSRYRFDRDRIGPGKAFSTCAKTLFSDRQSELCKYVKLRGLPFTLPHRHLRVTPPTRAISPIQQECPLHIPDELTTTESKRRSARLATANFSPAAKHPENAVQERHVDPSADAPAHPCAAGGNVACHQHDSNATIGAVDEFLERTGIIAPFRAHSTWHWAQRSCTEAALRNQSSGSPSASCAV